jgi:ABC-type glycerol-3-phosphate transport system permease component
LAVILAYQQPGLTYSADVSAYSGDYSSIYFLSTFLQQYSTDWGSLMASAALAMVPTLILFLFIQKYMISGATAGAVKG